LHSATTPFYPPCDHFPTLCRLVYVEEAKRASWLDEFLVMTG